MKVLILLLLCILLLLTIVSSQDGDSSIQHDNIIDSIVKEQVVIEQANHDIVQEAAIDTNDIAVEATFTTNEPIDAIEPIVETKEEESITVTKEEPIVSIETKQSNESESTKVDVNDSDIKIVPKLIKQLVEFFITFPKNIIQFLLNILPFKSK